MSARLSALVVWGLVAASVVFWALRLSSSPSAVPPGAALAAGSAQLAGDLTRMLGAPVVGKVAQPAAPAEATRFRLTGVVATKADRTQGRTDLPGIALIAVDGAPPRAYRVGDPVDSRLALLSVALRSASLGERTKSGTVAFVLELPPPSPAATGSLSRTTGTAAPPSAVLAPQPLVSNPVQPPPGAVEIPQPATSAMGSPPLPGGIAMQQMLPGVAPSIQVGPMPPGFKGMADDKQQAVRAAPPGSPSLMKQ